MSAPTNSNTAFAAFFENAYDPQYIRTLDGRRFLHLEQVAAIRDRVKSMQQQMEDGNVQTDLLSLMTKDELLVSSSNPRQTTSKTDQVDLPQRVDHWQV